MAICSCNLQKVKKVAGKFNIPNYFDDWKKMLDSVSVDILSIAVPPSNQFEIAKTAMQKGIHLFLEKPLGGTAADGNELLHIAKENSVNHMVDFEFEEIFIWKKLHELLRGDIIGSLSHIMINWHVQTYANENKLDSWKRIPAERGGVLNLFASHTLFYLEWLFGKISTLNAYIGPEDRGTKFGGNFLQITCILENKIPVSINISDNSCFKFEHKLEVFGEKGVIFLDNQTKDYINGFKLMYGKKGDKNLTMVSDEQNISNTVVDGRIKAVAKMIDKFLLGIENKCLVAPSIEAGVRVELLIEKVLESNNKKTWVNI